MIKKILFVPIITALFFVGAAHAQTEDLPSAGLTPESPVYFLDKFGEAIREFFTFNPEAKARLQITFAAERISEIKVILEDKGVEARGLEVAQARLRANLAKAVNIVVEEKQKGKDVSSLAKELDDEFEEKKNALKQSFKEQERALETKGRKLKKELREARQAGDTTLIETLLQELAELDTEEELLDIKEDEFEDELEAEEEKLEDEMEASEEAEGEIEEALGEKQELLEEAAEEGVTLPANIFAQFDSLISQAQSAFDAGNYQEAELLAEQADELIESVGEAIEKLKEELEDEEDEEDGDENEDEEEGESDDDEDEE